jgi:hypothetical protein
MSRRFAVVLGALTCALVAGAAAAPAAVGARPARPLLPTAFEVPASNGYSARVSATELERGSGEGRVELELWKPGAEVVYTVVGRISGGGIEATFGELGRVDVAFRQTGQKRIADKCSRGSNLYRLGLYEGTVELQGEEGFAEVAGPVQAPSLINAPYPCSVVDAAHGSGRGVIYEVRSRDTRTTVVQNRPGARVRFTSQTEEHDSGLEVERTIEALGGSGSFHTSRNLRRAEATAAPAPFSGSAEYSTAGPHRPTWLGDLTADFPGRPDVPLATGPAYARIEHGTCRVILPKGGSETELPPGSCLEP